MKLKGTITIQVAEIEEEGNLGIKALLHMPEGLDGYDVAQACATLMRCVMTKYSKQGPEDTLDHLRDMALDSRDDDFEQWKEHI